MPKAIYVLQRPHHITYLLPLLLLACNCLTAHLFSIYVRSCVTSNPHQHHMPPFEKSHFNNLLFPMHFAKLGTAGEIGGRTNQFLSWGNLF